VAAALLLVPAAGAAQEQPDGPPPAAPDHGKVATDDATPAGAGTRELELGYLPSVTHHGGGSFERAAHAHVNAFSVTALYGVTGDLDLKVTGGFAHAMDRSDPSVATRGSGLTDLTVAARWRLLASARRALDVMLTTAVVAPIGHEEAPGSLGLTQGFWSVRNALVASKDWGRVTGNAELALTLPVSGGAGEFRRATCANLAVGYAVRPWLQPLLEANYDVARGAATSQRLAVTAGVNLAGSGGTRLMAGVQRAVWGRNVVESTGGLVALKTGF
jgi:hypothetical protein